MISFNDLSAQQVRLRTDIDIAIAKVLDRGHYIFGPEVAGLETQLLAYTGYDICITVANGTDALQMALIALGVGSGDKMITSGSVVTRQEAEA